MRILHNGVTTAFFIWVITGGLDAYAGTYDAIGRRSASTWDGRRARADRGRPARLGRASGGVQVLVYRGVGRRWPDEDDATAFPMTTGGTEHDAQRRFDPRAITLTAVVLFAALASTDVDRLGTVAVFLGAAR